MTTNTPSTAALPAGIDELFDSWRTAWLSIDKKLMVSLFDANAPDFVYQAEEQPAGIHDAEGLIAYWDIGADTALAAIPAWDVRSRTVTVTGEIVVIFAVIYAEIVVNGLPGIIKGDMRASLLARKVGNAWKIFHYHEGREVNPAAYISAAGEEVSA